jgi:hypothetical protein
MDSDYIKMSELSTSLTRIKKQNRYLLISGIGLGLVLLAIGWKIYDTCVLQYAAIKDIRIEQSSEAPQEVVFYYKVSKPGLIEFWHGNAFLKSQATGGEEVEHQFTWRWNSRGDVNIGVRFRSWILPGEFAKQFQM